jgi:hypothetical protein
MPADNSPDDNERAVMRTQSRLMTQTSRHATGACTDTVPRVVQESRPGAAIRPPLAATPTGVLFRLRRCSMQLRHPPSSSSQQDCTVPTGSAAAAADQTWRANDGAGNRPQPARSHLVEPAWRQWTFSVQQLDTVHVGTLPQLSPSGGHSNARHNLTGMRTYNAST